MSSALPAGWLPGGGGGGSTITTVVGTSIADIVTLIARRARRTAAVGSNAEAEILSEIVVAQRILEEGPTLPWFLRQNADLNILADVDAIDLDTAPVTVIRLQDDRPLAYIDPTSVAKEPVVVPQEAEFLIMQQKFPGAGPLPKMFVQRNEMLIVRPKPTQALTYRVRVYAKDVVPTTSTTNLWSKNFSDLLMNIAGAAFANSIGNSAAQTFFEKGEARARSRYIRALTAHDETGQEHIMGDP